jgi:hypothetical protein
MKQFVSEHFAVMVVLLVFFALFGAYMFQIHWQTNTGTVDWLEGEMKEVIGALLMGLTASRIAQAGTEKPEPTRAAQIPAPGQKENA